MNKLPAPRHILAWGVFMGNGKFYRVIKIRRRAFWGAAVFVAAFFATLFTVSAATAPKGVKIPIVMYHAVLEDERRHGSYVISPAELENDMIWLSRHGYTTVLLSDIIAYEKGEKELPEKPVVLTFDDGYYNNYLYAFPLAKAHKAKFVLSPIVHYTDLYTETGEHNAYYSHVTWEQLKEMADSGLVEVQNHSFDLHQEGLGVKKRRGETVAQYEQRLREDLGQAQREIEEHVGTAPNTLVYPFGAVSRETPEIAKKLGFACTLSCEEKISQVEPGNPDSLFDLGRYLRPSGISPEEFFTKKMKLAA